jgi:hypothetical protein
MSLVTSIKNQNLDRLINAHLQNYLVVVLSGLLVLQSYVFLSVESATGYETSIVTAMPLEYWILFYSVLAGGIVTLIAAAVTRSSYWKHGIGIVLANYLFYFTLPKTRGYKLWGRGIADLLQHLGYVKEIINTGALPGTWYPGEHVLMAELTMLGVPFEGISYLTLFLFTAIQIVAIGALVRMFTEKRGSLAVGLAAGVPLVYTELHLSLHPALTSFMMVPALLLVVERYRRSGKNGYLLLYALFCLFFVYTHPMTTLFVFGLLLAVAVYARFNDWLTDTNTPSLSPRLAVVLLPMLFIWLINFRQTRLEVRKVFAPTDEKPPGTAEIQEATEISFTVLELAKKFLHLYGAPFFYLCTAGLFALFVVIAFRRGVKRYDWHLCVLQFGAGLGIAFVFLQNNLIVDTPIRAARYAMLFAAILVGLVTVHSIQRSDLKLTAVLTVRTNRTAISRTPNTTGRTTWRPNTNSDSIFTLSKSLGSKKRSRSERPILVSGRQISKSNTASRTIWDTRMAVRRLARRLAGVT